MSIHLAKHRLVSVQVPHCGYHALLVSRRDTAVRCEQVIEAEDQLRDRDANLEASRRGADQLSHIEHVRSRRKIGREHVLAVDLDHFCQK